LVASHCRFTLFDALVEPQQEMLQLNKTKAYAPLPHRRRFLPPALGLFVCLFAAWLVRLFAPACHSLSGGRRCGP
jgi:hypothetical protein